MDRERVMQLWNNGYSTYEIADETGYHVDEVSKIINELTEE